ncbi:MAG: PQQ-binding-like beta-propeller repeat protein [Isosphaeraceae bacterium]
MATLEVHDDQGKCSVRRAGRATIRCSSAPAAACDIVLAGAGVAPVHGRIRWKKGRYKVEASPGAEYVVVNGHKMTSASLHQGDELGVGPCRIFVFRLEEDLEGRPRRPARRPDEERTRVLEGPPPHAPEPAKRKEPPRRKPARTAGSLLEREEWLEELGIGGKPAPEEGPEAPQRSGSGRPDKASPGRLRRWIGALTGRESEAPGQERIASSPVVFALVGAICLLALTGLGLRSIIARTMADQQFNRAMEAMEDGDYRNAIRDFDRFLESYPEDPRAGKARVRRALANVRQYISVSGGTWSTALEAVREMYQGYGQSEEFRDERVELAELVIRIGEGLADRARRSADARSLEEAESAVPLHAQIAGEPAPAFLQRSRLPGLIDQARAAVRMADDRRRAGGHGRRAPGGLGVGSLQGGDAVVAQYADLMGPELIRRMTGANDLIRRAVKVSRPGKAARTEPRPELLGPPTSLVLRSGEGEGRGAGPAESSVYALADGFISALDAATGAPIWQRPVGLSSPFVPVPVAGTPSVLAVDARHGELLRLDSRDGRLIWRQELGEAVDSPPLALGEQLFQTLPGGRLLVISLGSGEVQASVDLGMPLSQSPVSDEQGRHLYVMGRRDCLFVLAREPLGCTAVEYLGHEDLSIPCAPLRLGRFLVVAENDRAEDSRWRVLVLDEDGSKLRLAQQVAVPGWTWSTPASSGSVLWATGDKGGVEAYALGDYASKNPLRSIARLNPDAVASGPAFGLAASERELWLAASRSGKYELDPERGQISVRSALANMGPALAPLQLAGRHLAATYQDPETGGVNICGVDPDSGTLAWRTVLGAPWPNGPVVSPDGAGITCLGPGGKELTIPASLLASGGFATQALPRPGEARMPEGLVLRMEHDGRSVSILAPRGGEGRVWVQAPGAGRVEARRAAGVPGRLSPALGSAAALVPGARTGGRTSSIR